ncbi:hypothetical protein, partial [Bradyrhizobium guangzhouense]|uniref:hypothetical protein n=1 Tax=Bradyrhizobium guangzhouense TaxID=1325095 RepID=UPI0019D6DE5B
MGASWNNTIAKMACAVRKFHGVAVFAVMVAATSSLSSPGLDRAIQYSETGMIESIGRGVLDAPVAAGESHVGLRVVLRGPAIWILKRTPDSAWGSYAQDSQYL